MKRLIVAVLIWVGMVAPSAAQTPEWRPHVLHVAIGASFIAHGADVSTSTFVLGRDPNRYREANPILRPFADKPVAFGAVKTSLAVGVNYALLKLHARHPRATLVIAIAQTVAVGYVAHRNAAQLTR